MIKDRITLVLLGIVLVLQANVENVATFFYGDYRTPVMKGDAADLVYYVQNLIIILILLSVAFRHFRGIIDKHLALLLIFLAIGKIVDQFYHPYSFEFSELAWILVVASFTFHKIRAHKKQFRLKKHD